MADAWGGSWATSWANSWNPSVTPPVIIVTKGGGAAHKRKRRETEDMDRAVRAAYASVHGQIQANDDEEALIFLMVVS